MVKGTSPLTSTPNMSLNPLKQAWLPRYTAIKNVDGGRAVHAMCLAYGLDSRFSTGEDVLTALVAADNGMTAENQLEKNWEAFSLGGSALAAAYPSGDDLLDIVSLTIADPARAFSLVDRHCQQHHIRRPLRAYTRVQAAWRTTFDAFTPTEKDVLQRCYGGKTIRSILDENVELGKGRPLLEQVFDRYHLVHATEYFPAAETLVQLVIKCGAGQVDALRQVYIFCRNHDLPPPVAATLEEKQQWDAEAELEDQMQPLTGRGRDALVAAWLKPFQEVWTIADGRTAQSLVEEAAFDSMGDPMAMVIQMRYKYSRANAADTFPSGQRLFKLVAATCLETERRAAHRHVTAWCTQRGVALPPALGPVRQ